MDERQVDAVLEACERALNAEGPVDLRSLGFWRAVAAVKRHPEWTERYANRIATIDHGAFARSVHLRFPLALGLGALAVSAGVGAGLVGASLARSRRWRGLMLLVGSGILMTTTHDLAHYLVGRALGIGFSQFFLGGKGLIEPGLKIDYASYLQTPARQRAWMHASGAVVTKAIAGATFLLAMVARFPVWVSALLGAIAGGSVLIDVSLSTRYSDWKRYQREMRVARHLSEISPQQTGE